MNQQRKLIQQFKMSVGCATAILFFSTCYLLTQTGSVTGLFLTPNQQAQRQYDDEDYDVAAKLFRVPMWQGVSQFRSGDYKKAVATFTRVNTAEGHFNRGNALVMLGKYQEAIEAYDRALELHPKWATALDNRKIAALRAKRKKQEGGDMTGGKLGADEIVVEPSKGKNENNQTEETVGKTEISDRELQSLWLHRVQTKPAEFLRLKFAFQLSQSENNSDSTEPE